VLPVNIIDQIMEVQAQNRVENPASRELLESYLSETLLDILSVNLGKQGKKKVYWQTEVKPCAHCGKIERRKRQTKYCSDQCRRDAYRAAERAAKQKKYQETKRK
jgi:NADH pyrophosphatase NudC (nudix superfamily)